MGAQFAAQPAIAVITASLARRAFNPQLFVGFWLVNRHITIRRLLAILVIAGLALSPLSRPAMAGTTGDASVSAMDEVMPASAMADTGDAMACCPAKAVAPFDCDKCVFVASCMSMCAAGMSAALFRPPFAPSSKLEPLRNDAWPDGLGHPPPEDPPRIQV